MQAELLQEYTVALAGWEARPAPAASLRDRLAEVALAANALRGSLTLHDQDASRALDALEAACAAACAADGSHAACAVDVDQPLPPPPPALRETSLPGLYRSCAAPAAQPVPQHPPSLWADGDGGEDGGESDEEEIDRLGASMWYADTCAGARWAQCDRCDKWRRLGRARDDDDEAEEPSQPHSQVGFSQSQNPMSEAAWFCSDGPDPNRNFCSAPAKPIPLGVNHQASWLPPCVPEREPAERAAERLVVDGARYARRRRELMLRARGGRESPA